MIRHLIASLVTAFLCFGCASDPGPKPTFQDGTRVGILNSLESYLTHQHITIDRMNSFTKQIKVDWNIPAYSEARISDALKKDQRFAVVPIKSPQIQSRLKQLSNQINSAAIRGRISQNLVDFIEDLASTEDLDVIIMAQSFSGESPWKIGSNPIVVQGYGLLTRNTLLSVIGFRKNWAHPYAQIRVVVFKTRPVARIGAGRPSLIRDNMDTFNWPADIRDVPQTELDKLRPRIQAYVDQAVKNALISANMISAE